MNSCKAMQMTAKHDWNSPVLLFFLNQYIQSVQKNVKLGLLGQ